MFYRNPEADCMYRWQIILSQQKRDSPLKQSQRSKEKYESKYVTQNSFMPVKSSFQKYPHFPY